MKLKKEFLDIPDEDLGPLEIQWRDYSKTVIHPQTSKRRWVERRRDFFAGAFTLLRMLQDTEAWTEPPPEGTSSWREALTVETMREMRAIFFEAMDQAEKEKEAAKAEAEMKKKKKAH